MEIDKEPSKSKIILKIPENFEANRDSQQKEKKASL